MKKCLLFLFILIAYGSFAQDILPITYGPIVSMTNTSLNSSANYSDQIPGAGYSFGGFLRLKIPLLYAQAEIAYSSKNVSVIAVGSGYNYNISFQLNGADVSTIVGVRLFGLGELGNLRVFGGYNWNNYSDITYSEDGNKIEASKVNDNNHSLLLGAGVDLYKLSFDLKYINGLTDLTKAEDTNVETKVVNLTVAFRFK